MKQDVVIIAALGAVVGYAIHCVRDTRRRSMQPKAKPEELQRWETEGGGVPAVQVPTPAAATRS